MTKKFIRIDGNAQDLKFTLICKESHSSNTLCNCSTNSVRDAALKLLQNLPGSQILGSRREKILPSSPPPMPSVVDLLIKEIELQKRCSLCIDNKCQYCDLSQLLSLSPALLGHIFSVVEKCDNKTIESFTKHIVSILQILRDLEISNDYYISNNFYLSIIMYLIAYMHMRLVMSIECNFPKNYGILKYINTSSTFKDYFHTFLKIVLYKTKNLSNNLNCLETLQNLI